MHESTTIHHERVHNSTQNGSTIYWKLPRGADIKTIRPASCVPYRCKREKLADILKEDIDSSQSNHEQMTVKITIASGCVCETTM